jgi:diacylglycerol kinase family enzyme
VYTTHLHRFLPLLRLMLYSLTHRMDEADDLEAWSADATTISGVHGPLPVAMDGEVVKLDNPLRFRTRPRALRVFAPVITA